MNDRRAIFSLIAMGRITPAQAERLLAVSSERSETAFVLVACVAGLLLMQVHGHDLAWRISQLVRSLLPEITASAHQLQHLVNRLLGGLL
jgi:hypothetical protein